MKAESQLISVITRAHNSTFKANETIIDVIEAI